MALQPTYRLAIFDFDGTLADSFPYLLRVINRLAEKYGLPTVDMSQVETLRGLDPRQVMRSQRVPAWKLFLMSRDFKRWMNQDIAQIGLFPGIASALEALERAGIILAVVSSNSKANVCQVLGSAHARRFRYFECGVSIFGKARKFKKILRQSGVPAEAAISIGDEIRDIQAARQANVTSGAVAWGYARVEALATQRPNHVFYTLDEMVVQIAGRPD